MVSNYSDGKTVSIANYEEEIHINSTTIHGGDIQTKDFVEWNEQKYKEKAEKGIIIRFILTRTGNR